jgi:type II secretory pathway component PulC
MDKMEKITPEEKLLKIIENPAIEKSRGKVAGAKSAEVPLPPVAAFLRSALASRKELLKYVSLPTINKTLAVVCACLTIYGLYNYLAFNTRLKEKYEKITTDVPAYKNAAPKTAIPETNIAELTDGYQRRNIFSFLPAGSAEKAVQQEGISQLASGLKLVGVIWSDNPQAMIEDSQGNKTYLVGKGDNVGQLKVNNINRNSVVLSKDGETWELR